MAKKINNFQFFVKSFLFLHLLCLKVSLFPFCRFLFLLCAFIFWFFVLQLSLFILCLIIFPFSGTVFHRISYTPSDEMDHLSCLWLKSTTNNNNKKNQKNSTNLFSHQYKQTYIILLFAFMVFENSEVIVKNHEARTAHNNANLFVKVQRHFREMGGGAQFHHIVFFFFSPSLSSQQLSHPGFVCITLFERSGLFFAKSKRTKQRREGTHTKNST